MSRDASSALSGQQLLSDFQSAFVNAATASVAQAEAERSETMIMDQLSSVARGGFLQPGALNQEWQAGITRESIDAHIKKAQADQLHQLSAAQLEAMTALDNKLYHGKKVRVQVLDRHAMPFEAVWLNKQTGLYQSSYHKSNIVGIIDQVLLDKNALILKPSFLMHSFVPRLQSIIAYAIDPQTMEPMVDITLLS